ncbi:uncharacterized protein LOC144166823 [Haemaphysalis longicornis]
MEHERRVRGSLRAAITKAIAALDALLEDPAAPETRIQGYVTLLTEKQTELRALDAKIQAQLSDEAFQADYATAWDYEHSICEIRARVHTARSSPSAVSGPSSSAAGGHTQDPRVSESTAPPAVPVPRVALPKLQIAPFSGDRRDWQGFWEQFDATIHANQHLTKIDKFKYLRSYMTGPAKTAIEGIRLAEDGYDAAIKILKDRFGRRDLVMADHVDALLAITPVKTSADVAGLRRLHDDISFRLNALEALGIAPERPNFVTLPTVPAESLPEQREGLIRDKYAPDARLAMITLIEVRNAARDDPQPMEPQTELRALDAKIQAQLSDEAFQADYATAWDYEHSICEIRARVHTARSSPSAVSGPSSSAAGGHTRDPRVSESTAPPAVPVPRVALPKLQIAPFSGDRRDWQGFWEQFDATIHANQHLTKIDKFKYLRSYMTGPAKTAIEGIRLAEDGYDAAIKILKDRFGRRDLLMADHVDALLAITPVKTSADVAGLRRLHDDISFRLNALEALGIAPDRYAVIIHRVLLKALPHDIALLYRQRMKESAANEVNGDAKQVQEILDFLRIQVEIREEGYMDSTGPQVGRPPAPRPTPHEEFSPPSAAALHAESSPPPRGDCCPLCDGRGHWIAQCTANVPPEEKRRRLQAGRHCFRCGKQNHIARAFQTARTLSCSRCSRRHLTSLCDVAQPGSAHATRSPHSAGQGGPPTVPKPSHAASSVVTASTRSTRPTPVYLQTCRAWATGPNGQLLVRVLLDTGSQRTFVRRDVSRALGYSVEGVEDLKLVTFGKSHHAAAEKYPRVSVTVASQNNGKQVVIDALEVSSICVVTSPPITDDTLRLMHDHGLFAADTSPASAYMDDHISILIGSDFYWKVTSGNISRLTPHLTAVETMFGWTLQGAHCDETGWTSGSSSALFLAHMEPSLDDAAADNELSSLWRLDAIGIKERPDASVLDRAAVEQFESDVRKNGARYEVPFMIQEPGLDASADNYRLAEQRLRVQMRRFRGQPELLSQYDIAIRTYFNDGHAERVPEHDGDQCSTTRYYMPHHGVVRRDAVTTKLRVVFDASSHVSGQPSLNSILCKGPKLDADLLRLILKFRGYPVVMVTDIKKAYLQMIVREQDRDALRFFWVERLPTPNEPFPPVVKWRMIRVPFGARSSPFLLAATLHHHLRVSQKFPDTAAILRESFYVDDLIIGMDDVDRDHQIYSEAKAVMAEAGMELRKWASNISSLRDLFIRDKLALEDEGGDATTMKVLGVSWNRIDDTLLISTGNVAAFINTKPTTKRTLLQTFARIYDPLGFLTPFTVRAKVIFQDLWKLRHPWDSPLQREQLTAWNAWCSELTELQHLCLPRNVSDNQGYPEQSIEIHFFADASPRAYGTAVYVRRRSAHGDPFEANLLISKGRVAPIKATTLPRLELLACLIAARLYNYLMRVPGLSATRAFFWSDAQIALHWICGEPSRWPLFVRNRVEEIQRLTKGCRWGHCSSKDNPADLITRGISGTVLRTSELWWHGPSWIAHTENLWPLNQAQEVADFVDLSPALASSCPVGSSPPEPLCQISDYSRYSRLLRVTAWVRRFVNNALPQRPSMTGPLVANEVQEAEQYWILQVQQEAFPQDREALSNSQLGVGTSRLLRLQPFLDSAGVIRVGGRLHCLQSPFEVRHPIILPGKNDLTRLLILAPHERLLHAGTEATLTEIR